MFSWYTLGLFNTNIALLECHSLWVLFLTACIPLWPQVCLSYNGCVQHDDALCYKAQANLVLDSDFSELQWPPVSSMWWTFSTWTRISKEGFQHPCYKELKAKRSTQYIMVFPINWPVSVDGSEQTAISKEHCPPEFEVFATLNTPDPAHELISKPSIWLLRCVWSSGAEKACSQ